MDWLVPAIFATTANSTVLALVYGYLAYTNREPQLKILTWAWIVYTARFVFSLLNVSYPHSALLAAYQICVLVSSYLLVAGIRTWIGGRKLRRFWLWLTLVVSVWVTVSAGLGAPLMMVSLPVFLFAGGLFVWAGVSLLKDREGGIPANGIVAVTLIVWGIHKLDYPLLRPIEWIAPWGYLVGALCAVLVGIGTVLVYFERARLGLTRAVEEQVLLVREVFHRVKNNLGTVYSLIDFEKQASADQQVRRTLTTVQNRVASIALVHEHVHATPHEARVSSRVYLESLCEQLRSMAPEGLEIAVDADDLVWSTELAVPCGLIVNELVTNALKHAYPDGRQGRIRVELLANADREATVSVADDGIGMPDDFAPTSSVGWKLVTALTEQLRGRLDIQTQGGTRITLRFPFADGVAKR